MSVAELRGWGARVKITWDEGVWKKIPGCWRWVGPYWHTTQSIRNDFTDKVDKYENKYTYINGYWWFDKPRWVWIR